MFFHSITQNTTHQTEKTRISGDVKKIMKVFRKTNFKQMSRTFYSMSLKYRALTFRQYLLIIFSTGRNTHWNLFSEKIICPPPPPKKTPSKIKLTDNIKTHLTGLCLNFRAFFPVFGIRIRILNYFSLFSESEIGRFLIIFRGRIHVLNTKEIYISFRLLLCDFFVIVLK